MINGFNIIIFAFSNWHAKWGTPQQMAVRLAPANRVLYVDEPRSVLHRLKPHRLNGTTSWEGERIQEMAPGVHVYHLPNHFLPLAGLPLPVAKTTMTLNGPIMAGYIEHAAKSLGFQNPLVWNLSPLHGPAMLHMNGQLKIYEETDIWANYVPDPAGRALIEWMELKLLNQADLVFIGSEQARKRREYQGVTRTMHVVSPGVDAEHFAEARLPETEVPEDIACLPRPRVGSVGVMDPARFDSELIFHMAQARPNWSLVLVGPTRSGLDLSALHALPNVHILGNRPIAELPGYLKGLDAGLIPYRLNEITRYSFPTKACEYLAAGTPFVMPPMPALMEFSDLAEVAATHDEFVAAVERLLASDAPGLVERRQAVARAHTWHARLEVKSACILETLNSMTAAGENV